jgi:hypothetical protein
MLARMNANGAESSATLPRSNDQPRFEPMKPPTLKQILDSNPCYGGAAFLKKSKTVLRAWKTCKRADWLCWGLSKFHLWTDAQARTFACDCAGHTLHFFEEKHPNDNRPRLAIEASRRTITDQSPDALAARDAARGAAWAAAWDAARDAAWGVARDAAWDAAWAAAWAAARDAARGAAWAAARDAAWAAAWAAETEWQTNRLREIVNPFKKP